MPGWGGIVLVGLILLMPFILAAAVREVYRRVPMTDRGLAAAASGFFTVYFSGIVIGGLLWAGAEPMILVIGGGIHMVLCFAVTYPLAYASLPSLHHQLRNVPPARKNETSQPRH